MLVRFCCHNTAAAGTLAGTLKYGKLQFTISKVKDLPNFTGVFSTRLEQSVILGPTHDKLAMCATEMATLQVDALMIIPIAVAIDLIAPPDLLQPVWAIEWQHKLFITPFQYIPRAL